MSLNYDLTKLNKAMRAEYFPPVQQWESEWDSEKNDYKRDEDGEIVKHPYDAMNPRLESLIMWTMATQIGTITEDNYRTAFYRYLRVNHFDGNKTPYLTLNHYKAAIGLRTNVINVADAKFNTWIKKREAEENE